MYFVSLSHIMVNYAKKKRHFRLLTYFPYFPATYFYFREVLKPYAVGWVKVRGHSTTNLADMTVVGNDRADKAADHGQEGKTSGEIAIATYMRRELGL